MSARKLTDLPTWYVVALKLSQCLQVQIAKRLNARQSITPERCKALLELHQQRHCSAPFTPATPVNVAPGTYYLRYVDEQHRRFYAHA